MKKIVLLVNIPVVLCCLAIAGISTVLFDSLIVGVLVFIAGLIQMNFIFLIMLAIGKYVFGGK